MAREYDPRTNTVKMRTFKKRRVIDGTKYLIWHAKCLEDGHTETGHTEAKAVLALASHINNKHPGKIIERI